MTSASSSSYNVTHDNDLCDQTISTSNTLVILWDVCFIFMVTVSVKPLLQFNLSTVRLIKIFMWCPEGFEVS